MIEIYIWFIYLLICIVLFNKIIKQLYEGYRCGQTYGC